MLELSPFQPLQLALMALLSPVVIAVAVGMGRRADQWQKTLIAGFAAACVNAVAVWLAVWLGLINAKGIGGEAGLFAFAVIFGTVWAAIGYRFARPRSQN